MRLELPRILNQKVLDYQQPDEVVDTIRSPLQRTAWRPRVIMNDWLYNTEHSHRFDGQVHALMDLLLLSPLQLLILIRVAAQRRKAGIHVLSTPPKLRLDVERCLVKVKVILG